MCLQNEYSFRKWLANLYVTRIFSLSFHCPFDWFSIVKRLHCLKKNILLLLKACFFFHRYCFWESFPDTSYQLFWIAQLIQKPAACEGKNCIYRMVSKIVWSCVSSIPRSMWQMVFLMLLFFFFCVLLCHLYASIECP